jgi:TolB-like protein/class 3 adenylate cyclase/tetratricopeptide (TPR) repeat protein
LASARIERQLTAILAADVAGYGRLTGLDEEGTHLRLQEHLRTLVDRKIAEYRGRVVKNTGDGMLAEFGSVVDAVRCALNVQRSMAARNANVPEKKRIEFRIGINVGDVIIDRGDIFGECVNVAVRLEGLAQPGGICVSARVREYSQDQFNITFEDVGEQQLKNIARPVRAYRVLLDSTENTKAALAVPEEDEAAIPRISILVLPFANLSNDPEQEYFADGLTDDLTTDLSRWTGSFVIARSTAFAHKRKAVDAAQIGRELHVRYVVEGSVRRSMNRVRVSIQLIDTKTGGHLWAERFDRDVSDLLEVQDEITGRIALALHSTFTDVGRRRAERSNHPDAVDFEYRGLAALYKPSSRATLAMARGFFENALQIDNRSTRAWAGLAETHSGVVLYRWSEAPAEHLRAAEDAAAKALECDPTNPAAHMARAAVLYAQTKLEAALVEYAKVIELGPNWPTAYARSGFLNALLGRPEETSRLVEKAIRMSPSDGNLGEFYLYIGLAQFMMDQLEEAIIWLRRSIEANPELGISYGALASACSLAGRNEDAENALSAYLRLHPVMTINKLRLSPYSDHPAYLAWRERFYQGLRKAGLPE